MLDPEAVEIGDLGKLRRLTCARTVSLYSVVEETTRIRNPLLAFFHWYSSWAIPGLGMFSEAYIIFSVGLIKPLQEALKPACFKTHTECDQELTRVENYVQICGIILGMLLFGALGDIIGRRWGSRAVATIMTSGSIVLVFTPLVRGSVPYLSVYIMALTWYGFGVGGEYPMASASAAERSQADPALRNRRGEQVVLTFSGQGMGNFVNACVIILCMAIFQQTGPDLDARGSRDVIMVQYAVAAATSIFMTAWRYTKLEESEVWRLERGDCGRVITEVQHHRKYEMYTLTLKYFWPRLLATCIGWVANDFAFYGNRLFQSTFIALLYPEATPFERMKWTVVNSLVALLGYWCAAFFVDKPWYGRRRMQNIGFLMLSVLFLICGIAFPTLTRSRMGLHTFQFLYFFSSFWNQFGPNCTTWLVAAEVFPTDVRSTFQGISAAAGKLGAIMADIVFSYVSERTTFYLSAAFGVLGFVVTWWFLPDTTGMSLDELDRMHKYAIAEEFEHYHGEAVNPRHLSPWERVVLRWHTRYDAQVDMRHQALQMSGAALLQEVELQGGHETRL